MSYYNIYGLPAEAFQQGSAAAQDMWNDPQLFQDFMPIAGLAMASGSAHKMPQTQQQMPQWRPTKVYPPEK